MNILIIGGGGREHALAWKISQNPEVGRIYCVPGNGGISSLAECVNISPSDFKSIIQFVKEKEIDFSVIGPEQPLVEGIVDYFNSEKLPVFGPTRIAAQMEGSKVFSKDLMRKYAIPTAEYESFNDYSKAISYIEGLPEGPLVVKADGLAAGKGSIVCEEKVIAMQAVTEMMAKKVFKDAGSQVVIEEFMTGEEASLFVITDDKDYKILVPAEDYKRAKDGDKGKNTGGMGSYAPTPFLTPEQYDRSIRKIVEPTLSALLCEGIEYRGVLYCGLMLTPKGPKVVEFNCRFGDPETQVILPLLKTDLMELFWAVQNQKLGQTKIEELNAHSVCVVMASGGYPEAFQKGKLIVGFEQIPDDVLVFHAATKKENDSFITSGGRVLGVTAMAENLKKAAQKAYEAADLIHFDNKQLRRDISVKAW
jgi:phosphoribosylamine--glycine ligase